MEKLVIVCLLFLAAGLLANFVLILGFVMPNIKSVMKTQRTIVSHVQRGSREVTSMNGSSSYVFVMEYKTQPEALEDCQSRKMNLVSIESKAENDFLRGKQELWAKGEENPRGRPRGWWTSLETVGENTLPVKKTRWSWAGKTDESWETFSSEGEDIIWRNWKSDYMTASGPVPQPELYWNGLEERCMCMGPEGDWKDMFCWEKLWYICEAKYKGPFPYDP